MSISRSAVDEARFGIRTAKATAEDAASVDAALDACRRERIELLILRIPTQAHPAVHAAGRAGALLTDTLCYYTAQVGAGRPATTGSLRFRVAGPSDADPVEALARAAFAGYAGHYGVDPRLRPEDADEVYPSWARQCCLDPAGPVLLAEAPTGLVAFAALRPGGDGALDVALLAVHPGARRRGAAAELLQHLLTPAGPLAARQPLTYSTQITNVAMQRLLARQGFLPTGSCHTFHWWAPGDPP